jgi:hypothetical protein
MPGGVFCMCGREKTQRDIKDTKGLLQDSRNGLSGENHVVGYYIRYLRVKYFMVWYSFE